MPRHSRQNRRYAQLGIATAFGLALIACTTNTTETSPAKAEGGASAEWGEFSVLIGEDIDLGVAKVSADGKVLGYLDPSCGLIVAAPSGVHEVVVEWETARISETLTVPAGGMVSVEIGPDLTFIPTEPVKREPRSCGP